MEEDYDRLCAAGRSHLPPLEFAALLSSSVEHLPARSSVRALCPELPSYRCTAAALAGWGALETPGLDPDPEPEPGPVQPWQPAGPLDVARTNPETPGIDVFNHYCSLISMNSVFFDTVVLI